MRNLEIQFLSISRTRSLFLTFTDGPTRSFGEYFFKKKLTLFRVGFLNLVFGRGGGKLPSYLNFCLRIARGLKLAQGNFIAIGFD